MRDWLVQPKAQRSIIVDNDVETIVPSAVMCIVAYCDRYRHRALQCFLMRLKRIDHGTFMEPGKCSLAEPVGHAV